MPRKKPGPDGPEPVKKPPALPPGLDMAALEATVEGMKRRGQSLPDKGPSRPEGLDPIGSEVSPEEIPVEVKCLGCGTKFAAIATRLGERTFAPKWCDGCVAADRAKLVDRSPLDVLGTLDLLGFNVRRHGNRTLADFDDVEVDDPDAPEKAKLGAVARGWCTRVLNLRPWDESTSLYLTGPTGTGKSQLMCSMARFLLEASYPRNAIVFVRARAWVGEIQDRYGTGTVDAYLDRFRRAGVLFVDDAGCEKVSIDAFRHVEDVLDAREGWPTVWSSNDGPEELVNHWADGTGARTDRFRSRLAGFEFIEFPEGDRRFA